MLGNCIARPLLENSTTLCKSYSSILTRSNSTVKPSTTQTNTSNVSANKTNITWKKLGDLPHGRTPITSAFSAKGNNYILSYGSLFSMNDKYQFSNVPIQGYPIGQRPHTAIFSEKKNKVYFLRRYTQPMGQSFLELDLGNHFVTPGPGCSQVTSAYSLVNNNQLIAFGRSFKSIHKAGLIDIQTLNLNAAEPKWEEIEYFGTAGTCFCNSFQSVSVGNLAYYFTLSEDRKTTAVCYYDNVKQRSYVVSTKGESPLYSDDNSCTLLTVNGKQKVLFFGGRNHHTEQPSGELVLFDIETATWEHTNQNGEHPGERSLHAALPISENRMIVFGGQGKTSEVIHPDFYLVEVSK